MMQQSLAAVVVVASAFARPAAAAPPVFQIVAFSGAHSVGRGISADGSIVAGFDLHPNGADGYRAFRWSAAAGTEYLGILGGHKSIGTGVSGDGTTVIGYSDGGPFQWDDRAFRWARESGMQELGTLAGGRSRAYGISADGTRIVGDSDGHAFVWNDESGMRSLGTLPTAYNSKANAISANGNVIIGVSTSSTLGSRAFRWTEDTGMQDLGSFGGQTTEASGISADGSTIVGFSSTASGARRAFRWTSQTGMVDIIGLPGFATSSATVASRDGTVVLGTSRNPGDEYGTPFIWTQELGALNFYTYLRDLGTDMTRVGVSAFAAVSQDGTAITGAGGDAAFRISGLSLPAPGTAGIGMLVLAAGARRQRRFGA
jgi:probable HAF family extracellular repeat protein